MIMTNRAFKMLIALGAAVLLILPFMGCEKAPEAPEGDLDLEAAGDEEGGVFEEEIFIHREGSPWLSKKLSHLVIAPANTLYSNNDYSMG